MEDSVLSFQVFGTTTISKAFEESELDSFVHRATTANSKIVVITSGGTSVPLEQRAVRYLDNFSTGTRGARSAENFLLLGRNEPNSSDVEDHTYAVIFLYREGSKLPFLQDIHPQKIAGISHLSASDVKFHDKTMSTALKSWKDAQSHLFLITYKTVQEYLFNLYAVAKTLRPIGKSVLFFLAAAVSDFYIPSDRLPEHKIQSEEENLILTLNRVPKCLGLLRQEWAPQAFIASFKLETDSELLHTKARAAMQRYGVNCVVGNILQTRYHELLILDGDRKRVLKCTTAEQCLETLLVNEIATMHASYLRKC